MKRENLAMNRAGSTKSRTSKTMKKKYGYKKVGSGSAAAG